MTLDEWAAETARGIIIGLLHEEGWELPETNAEEVTTRWLERTLKEAVIQYSSPKANP
jgi:hypothetical protein